MKKSANMHCDDKRTLFVLKEEIEKKWEILKESNLEDSKLKDFSDSLTEYFELKQSSQ